MEFHNRSNTVGAQVADLHGDLYQHFNCHGGTSPKIITTPRQASTSFVGRETLLQEIGNLLCPPDSFLDKTVRPSRRPLFILEGVRASGKTQVALRFAELNQVRFQSIVWVDASGHESARRSYRNVAIQVGLEHTWEAGKTWLAAQEKWLLVIDNADDFSVDVGKNYMPAGVHGAVLVTTINTEVGVVLAGGDHSIRHCLKDLSTEDSVSLLLKTMGVDNEDEELRGKGKAIVTELQGFPLAIVLAGAALRRNNHHFNDYLAVLKSNPTDLLLSSGPTPSGSGYDHTVYAAWEISLNMIHARHPEQAAVIMDLLDSMAYLHHENVPDSVLTQVDLQSSRGSSRRFVTALARGIRVSWQILWPQKDADYSVIPQPFLDKASVAAGLFLLSSYSMTHHDPRKGTVSTHKLVHSWIRHRMGVMRQSQVASLACEALHRSIPDGIASHDHRVRTELYPHIGWFIETAPGTQRLRTGTLQRFARVAQESGNFALSQSLYEDALARQSYLSGSQDPEILSITDSLAGILDSRGRYHDAADLAERAMTGRAASFGPDSLLTLASKARLAMALKGQGHYSQARAVNEAILQSLQQPKDDPETQNLRMEVTHNLASILQREGDYEKAAKLADEVVAIRRKLLTASHPETLESMAKLALIKEKQDRWSEAQALTEDVLRRREDLLGKLHPDTLTSQSRLGGILSRQGQYEKAEEILTRVLESSKIVLGIEHPDTLASLTKLAEVQTQLGKYELAERNLRSASESYRTLLMPNHHYIRIVEGNLAVCLRYQGTQHGEKYKEAEKLYWNVLRGYKEAQESLHPEALLARANLAVMLREQGRLEDSERVGREAVEAWETSRGPDDPGTLRSKDNLGWTIRRTPNRLAEAKTLIAAAVDGLKMVLGPEDRDTLEATSHLAHVLRCEKKYVEAWVHFAAACQGFAKSGVQHWCFDHFAAMKDSMKKKGIQEPPSPIPFDSRVSDSPSSMSEPHVNNLSQGCEESHGTKRPLSATQDG